MTASGVASPAISRPGLPPGRLSGLPRQTASWPIVPNPSPTLPAEATILDRCLDKTPVTFATGMSMLALFTDDRGYVAYVGAKSKWIYCGLAWDGSFDSSSGMTSGAFRPDKYAPAGSLYGLSGMGNMVDGATNRLPGSDETLYSRIVYGTVTKDVRRVTLTVEGVGPVQADVRGAAWVARVVFHGQADRTRHILHGVVTTYDAAGRMVGDMEMIGG